MNRKAFCQACHNQRNGVKTRMAVPHTCGMAFNINSTGLPGTQSSNLQARALLAALLRRLQKKC